MRLRRCPYCGEPITRNQKTCKEHRDLIELDAEWWGSPHHEWWLTRFTLDEIRLLAATITM